MNPHYPLVAERAGHRCEYCHAPEVIFNFPFEVEHIIPSAQHGDVDNETNWALSCRACNLHKSDYLDGVDPETQTVVRLFHPRRERWEKHFRVVPATVAIAGLTPVGRATVARLRMNTPTQLAARQQWMQIGVFP